jgi:hypothetical protein
MLITCYSRYLNPKLLKYKVITGNRFAAEAVTCRYSSRYRGDAGNRIGNMK